MLSLEKWLWWKEKYIDRGKSFPGLYDCWFHFWWNPRVIFLEHLANTNFLIVIWDLFSILVCENSRFSLASLGTFLSPYKRSKQEGTAQAVFAGYGLDYCKFLRVVHVQNIFKRASLQRHVTAYIYPLKRRKSLFWGPKFHNFPGEHALRTRQKNTDSPKVAAILGAYFGK